MRLLTVAFTLTVAVSVFFWPQRTTELARVPHETKVAVRHVATRRAPVPRQLSPAKALTAEQVAIRFKVAEMFPDVPEMVTVVACESRYRQFGANGKPLISKTNDVGVAQINIPTWGGEAQKLGLDIYNSVDDNLVMARIVYTKQGISAWTCKG